MLRLHPSRLSRLLLVGLAAAALLAAAGCASDDDSSAPPAATTAASRPAAPAATDRLSADDAQTLLTIRQTVARYCARHRATACEVTGAIATLESLYEIDPTPARPTARPSSSPRPRSSAGCAPAVPARPPGGWPRLTG